MPSADLGRFTCNSRHTVEECLGQTDNEVDHCALHQYTAMVLVLECGIAHLIQSKQVGGYQ